MKIGNSKAAETEKASEAQKEESVTFISSARPTLNVVLACGKVKFMHGGYTTANEEEIKELRALIEKPGALVGVREADKAALAEHAKAAMASIKPAAVKGGVSSTDVASLLAKEQLKQRDANLEISDQAIKEASDTLDLAITKSE